MVEKSSTKKKDAVVARTSKADSMSFDVEARKSNGDSELQRHVMTSFLSKKIPPTPEASEMKSWSQTLKHPLSYIFFWWLLPVMKVGYKRTLQATDLWKLDPQMEVESMYKTFISHLNAQVVKNQARAQKRNPTISEDELLKAGYTKITIPWALFKTLKFRYTVAIFIKVLYDCATTLTPLLSKTLINYVEKRTLDASTPAGKGVGYAIGLSLVMSICGILYNHYFCSAMTCGVQVKALLTKLLLEKSFKIDAVSKQKYSSGKITSLMGTDIARIDLAIGFQPFFITFPIPIIIIIALLIVNIGVSALSGIAIFLLAMVVIGGLSKLLVLFRERATVFTDERVTLVREVLNSIKMIKYYGWEAPYHETIKKCRSQEAELLFKMQCMRGTFMALAICLPTICSMVAFLVLHAVDPGRSPADIFSSVSLFGLLATQLIMVPIALSSSIDAFVGIERVKGLMQCNEEKDIDPSWEQQQRKLTHFVKDDSMAVQIKDAEFKWDAILKDDNSDDKNEKDSKKNKKNKKRKEEKSLNDTSDAEKQSLSRERSKNIAGSENVVDPSSFTGLHNINLNVKKGEFLIITGSIGSGKSSLLSAIAGVMPRKAGVLQVNDSLLWCGYPWVQNTTIRENILFGQPFDAKKYERVLGVCSLNSDLESFFAGDMTEVGERGVTLSGGQKARVNLARAVYNDKEIILLDDVLSAVDSRVGKHIMESCIMGLLKSKTRILATHQLSLIDHADRVVFLCNDGNALVGTVDELKSQNQEFFKLMEYSVSMETEEEKHEREAAELAENQLDRPQTQKESLDDTIKESINERALQKQDIPKQQGDGVLVTEEERAVNKIQFQVYKNYVTAGAGKLTPIIVFLIALQFAITTFCQLFTNTWLSFWIEKKFDGRSDSFYIGLYIMFCFLGLFFTISEFVTTTFLFVRCAKNINLRAVKNVFYAPMSFFDTTPMGRVMNRFTKDTDALDNELGDEMRTFILPLALLMGVIILCIIYLPWIAIAVPFLALMVICLTSFYQASSREIKRLEAVSRSFVYSNFDESLNGMNTIKAYRMTQAFIGKNDRMTNKMNEAYYINVNILGFLGIHFDIIGNIFSVIISLLCISRQFNISAASTGLVISYVFEAVNYLSLLITALTEVENKMNSAERLIYYAKHLPQEADYEKPALAPPPQWPENASIVFDDVCLRYREGLPLVLRNLSFQIKPGEKIGICGRTGAGKSSIMTALYRLSELDSGRILIDNVDVSQIGLKDLRTKLCIIPQDPVLFKGTLRRNLDPFGESTDDQLWDSLRRAGLIEESILSTIKKQKLDSKDPKFNTLESLHKFHLDQHVEEEGNNFSLGERQLIALARALLRDSKILILDEATSSVDYETDSSINNTIRTEFKDCTILCIAHRLNTILKFDKIMVLEKGQIGEFGKPIDLFNNKNGIFRDMCERSHITKSDFA